MCREWREKAKPFFKHIAIFEHGAGGHNRTVVRSRDLSFPGMSAVLLYDAFPGADGVFSPARVKNSGALRERTTIDGYFSISELPQARGPRSQWPTVFYRLLNPSIRDRDFSDFLSCCFDGDDVVRFADFSQGNFLLAGQCPEAPTTLALTIDCYTNPSMPCADTFSGLDSLRDDFRCLETLTVVLMDCQDVANPAATMIAATGPADKATAQRISDGQSLGATNLGAACELLFYISDTAAVDELAVVGLEGFVPQPDYLPYLNQLCSALADEFGHDFSSVTEDTVPSLGRFLKFYTHQQYREMVGRERYRLLTER